MAYVVREQFYCVRRNAVRSEQLRRIYDRGAIKGVNNENIYDDQLGKLLLWRNAHNASLKLDCRLSKRLQRPGRETLHIVVLETQLVIVNCTFLPFFLASTFLELI